MSSPLAGTVVSVNVGMPRDVQWQGRTVHTGIWKRPVDGPVMVRRLNLDGDGQGDKGGHGGEQRAVMLYQVDSYRHWERHLDLAEPLEHGVFGENLTVTGMADDTVCIGDRYRLGGTLLEVTQPRVTCFRVGVRLGQPPMPGLLVSHHRPGFYLRVLREGQIRAGDAVELVTRGRHALTIEEVDGLLYLPDPDLDRVRDAADIPALSPGWRQSFQDMLRADREGTAAPAAGIGTEPGWHGFRPLRVAQLTHEADDVLAVEFASPDGAALPAPLPGQYLTLQIAGAAEPAPVRSYSIWSAAGPGGYRIAVKREASGLASRWLHANLQVGDLLPAAAPRGAFTLDGRADNPVVLVSAGIGVTPVLAMLQSLAASGSRRSVWWLHTTRDAEHHAFAGQVETLLAELPNARARVYYTRAGSDAADDLDVVAGRMDAAALSALDLPHDATVYACGPQVFMDAITAACHELGITDVRTELFGTLAAINPGIVGESGIHHPHRPDGPEGSGPLVTFARSGLSAPWAAQRYATLLDFAEACDVPTRWSCRSGVCHTCSTQTLSGGVRYVDDPPVPPADGAVLLCCAQPAEPLVLDM